MATYRGTATANNSYGLTQRREGTKENGGTLTKTEQIPTHTEFSDT